jgi:cation diffusion facilitator family transporter
MRALPRWLSAWLERLADREGRPVPDLAMLRMVQPQVLPPAPGGDSAFTVVFALSLDLVLVAGKAVAAALTGSAALFAETLHTAADATNGVMLYRAVRRSRRPPDLAHPYGYGLEMYYWALLAAVIVFTAGGALSVWEGVSQVRHPGQISDFRLGAVVLAVGFVFDVTSFTSSRRQLHREAAERRIKVSQHLATTTDTTGPAVYLQDLFSIIGGLLALAGLIAGHLIGSAIPDGLAAIAVGLLLAGVAIRLARRNQDLLTLRADSPDVLRRIYQALTSDPGVAGVGRVTAIYIGPHRLLVLAEIQPATGLTADRLCELINTLRPRVQAEIPRVAACFLMPVSDLPDQIDWSTSDQEYWALRFHGPDQA